MSDQSTWGYAVRNDGYWRMVNGPVAVDGSPEWSYPDPETEKFVSAADGPPDKPAKTRDELIQEANALRDQLLAKAAIRIAPLQYAVDLGDATADDEVSLKKWKQYSVALNRIDQQPGFPANIDWPVAPS